MDSCVDFLQNRFLETAADVNVKDSESIDNEKKRSQQHARTGDDEELDSLSEIGTDVKVKECESIDSKELGLHKHTKTNDDQELNRYLETGTNVNITSSESDTDQVIKRIEPFCSEDMGLHKLTETVDEKDSNSPPDTGRDVTIKYTESVHNKNIGLRQCEQDLNSLLETRTVVDFTDNNSSTGLTAKEIEFIESEEKGLREPDETCDNKDFNGLPETDVSDEQLTKKVADVKVREAIYTENGDIVKTHINETFNSLSYTGTDVNAKEIRAIDNDETKLQNLTEVGNGEQFNKPAETGADVNVGTGSSNNTEIGDDQLTQKSHDEHLDVLSNVKLKDIDGSAGFTVEEIGSIDITGLCHIPEAGENEQLNRLLETGVDMKDKGIKCVDNEEIGLHQVTDDEHFDGLPEKEADVNFSELRSIDNVTGTYDHQGMTGCGKETEYIDNEEMLLHKLVENGDDVQLKRLIDKGVDVNTKDYDGNTALAIAARYGDIDCVSILIAAEADVNIINDEGLSALIHAVGHGHPDCVQLLIDSGADVNHPDNDGSTALIWAATNHCSKSIDMLLKVGADVNKINNNNTTALLEAAMTNYMPYVKRLAEAGADVNGDLICATQNGDTTCINALMKVGADVNTVDVDGNTPLIWATRHGYSFCLDVLLQAGAYVNQGNVNGETALMLASKIGFTRLAQKLLNAKADVNKRDKDYKTALTWATKFDKCAVVKILVTAGASVNLFGKDHCSPLLAAIQKGCEQCVDLLLQAGADVNHCDRNGFTPLQYAEETNNKYILEMLIEAVSGSDRHSHTAEKQVKGKSVTTASVPPRIIRQVPKQNHGFIGKPAVQSVGGWKAMTVASRTDGDGGNHGLKTHIMKQNHDYICRTAVQSEDTTNQEKNSGINVHAAIQSHGIISEPVVWNEGQWKPKAVVSQTYGGGENNRAYHMPSVSGRNDYVKGSGSSGAVKNTTSLILAAESGHYEMVRLLIESGADVNATRSDGYTALMCAAQNGHNDCAKLLIDSGASVNTLL